MTNRKPEGRSLSRLLQQFAELEVREWAALDVAGITKLERVGRGVVQLSPTFDGLLRDPAIVLERIEKLPNDRRGWKKRNELWRHLMTAMNARLTIEAIEDQDLARAVENAYKAGMNHLRHLAEIGDKVKSGRRSRAEIRDARWLASYRELCSRLSGNASIRHIAKGEGKPINTVRSAIQRARKKVGAQA